MDWPLIISGLGVGLIFGFTLQHGRFCMNTAFREVLLSRDFTVFRIYVVALLILIIGANGLEVAGIIKLRSIPFTWLANVLGGYLFGIGMVLGGGCATGTLYRIGEGMIGSWFAALGFLLAAASTLSGALNPIAKFLWFGPGFDPSNPASAKFMYSLVDAQGNPLPVTIYSVLGVNRWLVIVLLAVPALIFIAKGNFKRPASSERVLLVAYRHNCRFNRHRRFLYLPGLWRVFSGQGAFIHWPVKRAYRLVYRFRQSGGGAEGRARFPGGRLFRDREARDANMERMDDLRAGARLLRLSV